MLVQRALPVDFARFVLELRRGGDELIDVPANGLVTRVTEEPLRGGIPGCDLVVEADSDDRRGADLEERFVVLRLAPEIRLTLA